MASRDTLDIFILGASFAGFSVAHNLLNNVFPYLQTLDGAPNYRVVFVAPSSHLYWNIAVSRTLVSAELVPYEKMFSPIMKGFEHYSPDEFVFTQGTAGLVDAALRQVTITLTNRANVDHRESIISTTTEKTFPKSKGSTARTLKYHALMFATGSSANSPLLSLHGPHEKTQAALGGFHKRLRNTNSVVVVVVVVGGGGGASGVQTASQLAVYFNDTPPKSLLARLRIRKAPDPLVCNPPRKPKTITPISGHEWLFPNLAPTYGKKVEKKLRRTQRIRCSCLGRREVVWESCSILRCPARWCI